MFGREFWENMIDFPYMVEQGVISPADLNLFHYVETAEEAWERIRDSLQD
jgi:predicted Rossmann-fold nucleotide-binding protein